MSKPKWHSVLPYHAFRSFYRWFRRTFFSAPRPPGMYFRIPAPPGVPEGKSVREVQITRITKVLGWASFAPNWEYSYHKRGEAINLARVVYEDDSDSEVEWWQFHVRGWMNEDGSIELGCHWEPEPTEYPEEHLKGVGFSRDRGMKYLGATLAEAGIDYEEVQYEG